MKKIILISIVVTTFFIFSCSKNNPTPTNSFQSFINKPLILDSEVTTLNGGSRTTQVLGPGYVTQFNSVGTYTFSINSVVQTTKNYEFDTPGTIYYWDIGSSKNVNQFFTIISIIGNKIHTQQIDAGIETIDDYAHY